MRNDPLLLRYRIVLGAFIAGLVVSGITAFPLVWELDLLAGWLGVPDLNTAMLEKSPYLWIAIVNEGLHSVQNHYPWFFYGTDWLAFGHLVIALFFVGPWRDPVANAWVLRVGLVACAGVLALAMICGPIRGIPIY